MAMKKKGFRMFEQGTSFNRKYLDRVAKMWIGKGKTPTGKTAPKFHGGRETGKRKVTASPSGSYTLWYKTRVK